jgi:hypothetical protein
MVLYMFRPNLNLIAVTLWFFFGVLAILGFLYIGANFFALEPDNHSFGFWIDTAVTTCGVAAISGLIVDAIRLISSTVWSQERPYRLKSKKAFEQNLA